jgi:hypothetical protein
VLIPHSAAVTEILQRHARPVADALLANSGVQFSKEDQGRNMSPSPAWRGREFLDASSVRGGHTLTQRTFVRAHYAANKAVNNVSLISDRVVCCVPVVSRTFIFKYNDDTIPK